MSRNHSLIFFIFFEYQVNKNLYIFSISLEMRSKNGCWSTIIVIIIYFYIDTGK